MGLSLPSLLSHGKMSIKKVSDFTAHKLEHVEYLVTTSSSHLGDKNPTRSVGYTVACALSIAFESTISEP